MRKLRSRRGETLTETLCAVLVTALALGLLVSMTAAAARLDGKTDKTVSELYSSVSKAEDPESTVSTYPTEASGTVSVKIGDGTPINVDVQFYGHQDQAVSYREKKAGSSQP